MEKTTHYQLNQWDGDDRIMRTDFNGDNAAIDEALHENAQGLAEAKSTLEAALETERQARAAEDGALQQAVAAEQTAREQAVTAEANTRSAADTEEANIRSQQDAAIRGELASAVAGAKSEATNAVNSEANTRAGQDAAIRQEFAAADAQLRSENMVVKLGDFTVGANTTQFDINIQSMNFSAYAEVWMLPIIHCTNNYSICYVRCNNRSDKIYYQDQNSGASDYMTTLSALGQGFPTGLVHFNFMGDVGLMWNPTSTSSYGGPKRATINLAPSQITTLNFYPSSNLNILAGSRFVFYGIKV